MSIHSYKGLYFERGEQKTVRVLVFDSDASNANLIKDVNIDAEKWQEIITALGPYDTHFPPGWEPGDGPPGGGGPEVDPSNSAPSDVDITSMTAPEVQSLIESTDSLEVLDALEKKEHSNQKYDGGRKSVLQLIKERRAIIKP